MGGGGFVSDRQLSDETEVIILGGGPAGLTLASQLRQAMPDLEIAIVEKRSLPAPEATYKVGESTVPISARYLSDVVGLEDHLHEQQLPKLGLRFFAPQDGNRDITKRPEFGPGRFPVLRTYQLDRGRLENALSEHVQELGVTLLTETQVNDVEIGDPHRVTIAPADGEQRTISARWLVDGSGRAGILMHQLGLEREVGHDVNAAWFRIGDRIAVDDWSADEQWQSRVADGNRWLSTVHLHGAGYWVWIIPLGSGSTSIGIVADPRHVPFEQIRRFEPALEWLRQNEPQLAEEVAKRSELLQDFHVRKSVSRAATQVFSPERWFITGEAAYFHDPLYSPGLDLISVANTFMIDLIRDSRAGREDIDQAIVTADAVFRAFADDAFNLYEDQYGLFDNAEAMAVKVAWEQLAYFTLPAPLAFGDPVVTGSFEFLPKVAQQLVRNIVMNQAFHALLRDWDSLAGDDVEVGLMSTSRMDELQRAVQEIGSEDELVELIGRNMDELETALREIIERVAAALGLELPEDEALLRADQKLAEFRLTELEPSSEPRPLPGESSCGLLWATAEQPLAGVTEGWAAWPS